MKKIDFLMAWLWIAAKVGAIKRRELDADRATLFRIRILGIRHDIKLQEWEIFAYRAPWKRWRKALLHSRLTIGRGKVKVIGRWSWGIEFSLFSPAQMGISPRFEAYCFKILSYPPEGEAFNKKRDIKGFWKIVWWQPEMTIVSKKLWERKGFRPRYVTLPMKISGLFRTW